MRLACLLVFLSLPASSAPNASLDKASKLFTELNYAEANKAIEAALKQPGNDRETLLKILELQAVLLATLNQPPKSTVVFSQLLSLNPEFSLTGNHPPRVTTAFFEARAWAASNGKLEVRQLDAVVEPGNVKTVRVEVTKDPAKLVKKVRFFIAGATVVSPVVGNVASAAPKVPAVEVAWWAQLLSDRDAVLQDVGSASWPKNETAPPKPVAAVAPVVAPVPSAEKKAAPGTKLADKPKPADAPVVAVAPPPPEPLPPPPMVKAQPNPVSKPLSVKRLAAFGLIGGAAVCAGIGVGFGVMANGTRSQVNNAPIGPTGTVANMNQKQGFELDARQRSQATTANALFISAGALALGGGALFLLSMSDPQGVRVAIVPTGPGVAVVGAFP